MKRNGIRRQSRRKAGGAVIELPAGYRRVQKGGRGHLFAPALALLLVSINLLGAGKRMQSQAVTRNGSSSGEKVKAEGGTQVLDYQSPVGSIRPARSSDSPMISDFGPITGEGGVIDLGVFELTAYDRTECLDEEGNLNRTCTGTIPQAGHTIAVDPTVIPLGSRIEFDGVVYTAEDTGGKIKGRIIDVYFDTHEETEAFGRQRKNLYLIR